MRVVEKYKYLLWLIILTIFSRVFYHTITPFFEDEGLFLLDASKNIFDIYVNSLYMKPFFGALYYHLVYVIAGSESFLYLHCNRPIYDYCDNDKSLQVICGNKAQQKSSLYLGGGDSIVNCI